MTSGVSRLGRAVTGRFRSLAVSVHQLLERPMERDVRGVTVKVWVSSKRELSRLGSYESKEPYTLTWIDSFQADDVFFDVGANIGQYSVYAALKHPGIRVYSFEPESQNFAALNRNIYLNGIAERTTAFAIAISESRRLDTFNLHGRFGPGEALHQFGVTVDDEGNAFEPVHRQGAVGLSLDELVQGWGLPCPNALKIDVDGLEAAVLQGARRVLEDPALRTILLEINEGTTGNAADLYGILSESGWRVAEKHPARLRDPSYPSYNVTLTRA